jgi:hypothetical protein
MIDEVKLRKKNDEEINYMLSELLRKNVRQTHIMSDKISDKLKPYYEGYALNPPKNSDRRVLSGVCLVHLPFMISAA